LSQPMGLRVFDVETHFGFLLSTNSTLGLPVYHKAAFRPTIVTLHFTLPCDTARTLTPRCSVQTEGGAF